MINRTLIARIQSYKPNWFQDTNWSDEDVLEAIAIAERVESGDERTYSFAEAMEDLELTGELGLVTRTERGFEVVDFQDLHNKECSLQQSSLAVYWEPGTSAVWLGQGEDRMHLGEEQVQSLVTVLQRWLDTGPVSSKTPMRSATSQ